MTPPVIQDLCATIVPHFLWPTSQWFYAHPLWYYHRPRTTLQLRTDRRFYQLVDPALRPLCRMLNDAGLRTTPSCQGHFYPKARFQRIWRQLRQEARTIRSTGLIVRDSENHHPFRFHNAEYELPWRHFAGFYAEASAHQGIGYLGILLPDRPGLVDAFRDLCHKRQRTAIFFDERLSAQLGAPVLNILVQGGDPDENAALWQEITGAMQQHLSCPIHFT